MILKMYHKTRLLTPPSSLLTLLLVLLLAGAGEGTPGEGIPYRENPGLGGGFYLPDTSILRVTVEGKSIFEPLPDSCFKETTDLSRNKAQLLPFRTAETFYQYLGEDLGLNEYQVLAHNFHTTLTDVSESISPDLDVVGAVIEISRETSSYELDHDCLSRTKLNAELMRDFLLLEEGEVTNPSLKSSWTRYDTFIKKYGTHYIKAAYYGNKVRNFVFARSSHGYSEGEMSAAVCLKLRQGRLTFCRQFSDRDYQDAAARESEMGLFYEVRGGTAGTRANMTVGEPTSEDISKFMLSETDELQDIRVTVEPLTELLKRRFLGTEYFARALNLLQYYEGFVALGCREHHVNGVLTRRFRLVSNINSIPEYRCELVKTGCRSDDDCHLSASSLWTHCYCYGRTCITSTSVTTADYGTYITRAVLTSAHGSTYEGENMSCHYRVGPWCQCDRNAVDKWDQIWPGSKSHLSQDLTLYRDLYRNGVLFNITISSGVRSVVSSFVVFMSLAMVFIQLP